MTTATEAIFKEALEITGKGMTALFAFMLIFFLLLILLDRVFPGKTGTTGDQGS